MLPVAALILAAGSATRMGRLKQLLPLGDKTVLRHSIDAFRQAGADPLVVVCGADPSLYADTLAGSGARLVPNRAAASEMADSIRLGLREIENAPRSAVLIGLADHPLVLAATCRAMIDCHREAPARIVIPSFAGRRGHPALFPAAIISEIHRRDSLRDIVREDPGRVLVVDVADEGILLDMDTEADYRKAVELHQARTAGAPERER